MLTFSPQRIIIGGGVMEQKLLFPLIRSQVRKEISSYLQISKIMNEIEDYIALPKLGGRSGIMGAFALAQQSLSLLDKPKTVQTTEK